MKSGRRLRQTLRFGFVALALALLGWGLASQWHGIRTAFAQMGPAAAVGSLLCALVGLYCSSRCWRALLRGLGSPLPERPATRVFFLSQIGKYLPGSVWTFLAQMELGRDLGVPRRRSAVAGVLFVGMHTLTGLVVAAATLPLVSPEAVRRYAWALALAPVGMVILYPGVLNPLVGFLLRLVRRPGLEEPLRGGAMLRAAGWLLVMWSLYGVSTLLLAAPLGIEHGQQAYFVAVGAYALSWAAGFLVVIAPAGLGVREAAMVLTLSRVMPLADAAAVAAASRVVQTAGDGLWALIAVCLRPNRDRALVDAAHTATAGSASETEPGRP